MYNKPGTSVVDQSCSIYPELPSTHSVFSKLASYI